VAFLYAVVGRLTNQQVRNHGGLHLSITQQTTLSINTPVPVLHTLIKQDFILSFISKSLQQAVKPSAL
jgi:hypothetical protein